MAYASDTRTTPRGPVGTDAKIDVWYPEQFTTREEAFKAQKDDGIKRLFPAVVFSVATAKRRGRLLDSVRSASIRRTLKALISGCYVVRRERKGRVLAYMLSERGLEEAARICEEVRGYIAEWAPLLDP